MTDWNKGEAMGSKPDGTRALSVGRTVDAPPGRVYEAFVDPAELAAWMHPPGARCEVHHFEAAVGGTYRITMSGDAPNGNEWRHTYGGRFEELVPGERIVQTEVAEADDPDMAAEITVSITFDAVSDGTEVLVTMTVPDEWPADGIKGWDAALDNLTGRLGGE